MKLSKKIKIRPALFWDVDPDTIDTKKHATYIIERVLDFGEPTELRWLFKRYAKNKIKQAMNRPRSQVRPESRALWSLLIR